MADWFSGLLQQLFPAGKTTPVTNTPYSTDASLGDAGKYHPESQGHKILSSLMPGIFHPGGSISINPNNITDVNKVIQHESVHALLGSQLDDGQLDKMNASNPYFSKLKPNTDVGDLSDEMPAYAATGEWKQVGLDPNTVSNYKNYFIGQLKHANPKAAAMYQELSNPPKQAQSQ